MPVYLRNQITLPTPTISDIPDDQNDDFLQDPDQRWDQLPQPFRFLNKIVFNVIDDAWEIANSREVYRIIDASKIRPPQFKCWTKLQVCISTHLAFEVRTSLLAPKVDPNLFVLTGADLVEGPRGPCPPSHLGAPLKAP